MSARTLRITLIVLTVIGVGLATYLTYIHYANVKPLCGKGGGTCLRVQTSKYSKLAGVPVALMGLIGYIAILATLLAPDEERWRFATVALTLGGFGFSAYLTYREVFSLEEICEYCVASAVLLTILLGAVHVALPARRRTRSGSSPEPDDAPAGEQPAAAARALAAPRSRKPATQPQTPSWRGMRSFPTVHASSAGRRKPGAGPAAADVVTTDGAPEPQRRGSRSGDRPGRRSPACASCSR